MNQVDDNTLRMYIDQVFAEFDRDRSGTLELQELAAFFSKVFGMMGCPRQVSYQEAIATMQSIDRSGDGRANKMEVFAAMKIMMNQQNQMQQQPMQMQGGYIQQGYNQQQQGYNQQGYNQQGYNQQGFNQQGFNQQGFNQQGFNQQGFNLQGYNQQGFNQQGQQQQGWGQQQGFNGQQQQGWNNQNQGQ